jgi:hypothetical protein
MKKVSDAMMSPDTSGTGIGDKVGYPSLVVPFGGIPDAPLTCPPFPPGFDAKPSRYCVSFAESVSPGLQR